MKQGGHLNRQISLYGRELVGKYFKLKETTDDQVSLTGYLLEQEDASTIQCKIFTKIHDERENLRVTGRDSREILKFQAIQRTSKKPVMILFVDCALGQCYGDTFDNLMKVQTYGGHQFPMEVSTHAGKIFYWSVELMPTLFMLTKEEKEHLASLISDNKVHKHQAKLF